MRKKFATSIIGLALLAAPILVTAQSLPSIPPNPTIEQLQQLVVQLTQILQQLLEQIANRGGAPSCTITTDKSTYALGETITLSWTSQRSIFVSFVPDDSGKDNLDISSYLGKQPESGSVTLKATVYGNPFVTMRAVNDKGQSATCKKIINVGTVNAPGGDIVITLDPSSPISQIVSAGSTGNTVGAFRLTTSGETITVDRMTFVVDDYNFSPSDVTQFTFWDGSTQVGSSPVWQSDARPAGYTRDVNLTSPVRVELGISKVITVKADLAHIGALQPGAAGHRVQFCTLKARGTGASSGLTVMSAESQNCSQGVIYMYRSFPAISKMSLPSTTLVNGSNDVLRFSVTALGINSSGLQIGQMTLTPTFSGMNVGSVDLYAYSDAAFSSPVAGLPAGGHLGGVSQVTSGQNMIFDLVKIGRTLVVPPGQTVYLRAIAGTSNVGQSSTLVTAIAPDNTYADVGTFASHQPLQHKFVWSGNSSTQSSASASDWANGYLVPGLSTPISQSMSGSGTVTPIQQTNPVVISEFRTSETIVPPGEPVKFVWESNLTTVDIEKYSGGCNIEGQSATRQFQLGDANGFRPGSGSVTYTPTESATYTLFCSSGGKDGSPSAKKTVTVSINPFVATKPSCSIIYSPTTISAGQKLNVSWAGNSNTTRTYTLSRNGAVYYTSSNIPESGNATYDYSELGAPGTITRVDTITGSGGTSTCTATATVAANDRIVSPNALTAGQSITSPGGAFSAYYQTDGHFVIYRSDSSVAWATGWYGFAPGRAVMQSDGNFVNYDASGNPYWSTGTAGRGTAPYSLVLQDDGNLVIYDANNSAIWAAAQGILGAAAPSQTSLSNLASALAALEASLKAFLAR